ncbi:MAG: Chemotaxis signal transduction protein [Candidatus Nitrotoga sp. SPKER]|nr:MAG: Chemotaxis signal transduction protein [Candidatus Nitrotoga sp. SPKER]
MQNEINSADSLLAPSVALHPTHTAGALMTIGLHRRYGTPLATAQEWIGFEVANIKFLVPHAQVNEISEMPPVFRLPNTGRSLFGLVNLHGNLVPVFDLASLINGACNTKSKTMLLVLGRDDAIAAIVVNGIPNRKRFGTSDRTALPAFPESIRDYISNAYAEEKQVWLELDHVRFFEMMAYKISC